MERLRQIGAGGPGAAALARAGRHRPRRTPSPWPRACGLRHQGWTANGFWGDELDSAKHPNAELARRAIERTRDGEVVVMHWGIRSRRDPFAGVLDEVIGGLQARGFCFATLPAEGPRMTAIADRYTDLTGWIFEHALQPLLYALGLMDWAEDAYAWLDFALFGLFGIAVAWAVCRPLEAWRPVEPVADAARCGPTCSIPSSAGSGCCRCWPSCCWPRSRRPGRAG